MILCAISCSHLSCFGPVAFRLPITQDLALSIILNFSIGSTASTTGSEGKLPSPVRSKKHAKLAEITGDTCMPIIFKDIKRLSLNMKKMQFINAIPYENFVIFSG